MHDQMQRQLESGAYKNVTLQQDPNRPNVFVGASTGTVDPAGRLALVDRDTTYARNDPNARQPAQRLRRPAGPVPRASPAGARCAEPPRHTCRRYVRRFARSARPRPKFCITAQDTLPASRADPVAGEDDR
jgi:hypothetical protein